MKSLPVGEFKAHFSELLEEVQRGKTIEVVYGKNRKPVARLVPVNGSKTKKKRKIGIMDGKMKIVFADDFKMTEDEFVNMK